MTRSRTKNQYALRTKENVLAITKAHPAPSIPMAGRPIHPNIRNGPIAICNNAPSVITQPGNDASPNARMINIPLVAKPNAGKPMHQILTYETTSSRTSPSAPITLNTADVFPYSKADTTTVNTKTSESPWVAKSIARPRSPAPIARARTTLAPVPMPRVRADRPIMTGKTKVIAASASLLTRPKNTASTSMVTVIARKPIVMKPDRRNK